MKLTKEIKAKIAESILDHRFKPEEQKLKAELGTLAVALYNERYSKTDRDLMAKLPVGWLPECAEFRARLGGSYDEFKLPEKLKFRHNDVSHRYGHPLIVLEADHKLSILFANITNRERQVKESRKAAEVDVWAILNSVGTVDKLRDRWPEALKIIDPIIAAIPKPANLPAIPMPELNARLKLPPKTAKPA